ncbi:MAG: baseplate J/gp47 family protein, partial [Eubacteriales bacterium]
GIGWCPIPELLGFKTLFTGDVSGNISLKFTCPNNWESTTAASFAGRLMRFRVLRADNCYMMPSLHTMPIVEDLKLSYGYGDHWLTPQRVQTLCGTTVTDQGRNLMTEKGFDIFSPLPYGGEGVYLGFDRKFESGPISMFFQMKRSGRFAGLPLRFEYSNGQGFTPLKLVDHTNGLQHPGVMQFMPPADFRPQEVEGVRRHWLRILLDGQGTIDYRPVVEQILINSVQIQNVETLQAESFFLEEVAPNMEFPLGVDNILNAQVYVNETRFLSPGEMKSMMAKCPERVRVEYDFLGQISRFGVLWDEVSDLRSATASDRIYLLDRMAGTIRFGDGVHGKIPSERQDVAFDVSIRRCSGSAGNLAAGSIQDSTAGILYVQGINNPTPTYGGCDLESLGHAYDRGADIVSSRNRLVSRQDYIRCATAYSDNIAQVACLRNRDLAGNELVGHMLLILLMRDCCEGAPSFPSVQEGLKRKMMERCELTCSHEDLEIVEPIYVEINVEIWLTLSDANGAFDVQAQMKQLISDYLQPVASDTGKGWNIGELPQEKNISLLLQSVHFQGRIRHIIATAKYFDHTGAHECALDDLKGNSVMIGFSGTHNIHMELPMEGG